MLLFDCGFVFVSLFEFFFYLFIQLFLLQEKKSNHHYILEKLKFFFAVFLIIIILIDERKKNAIKKHIPELAMVMVWIFLYWPIIHPTIMESMFFSSFLLLPPFVGQLVSTIWLPLLNRQTLWQIYEWISFLSLSLLSLLFVFRWLIQSHKKKWTQIHTQKKITHIW